MCIFSCKGNVISNQKIKFYVYNNPNYKIAPIRIFRPIGTNISEVGLQCSRALLIGLVHFEAFYTFLPRDAL